MEEILDFYLFVIDELKKYSTDFKILLPGECYVMTE